MERANWPVSRSMPGIEIQVEVETLDQLSEARAAGATNVLLDNFTLERMREAVVLAAARALHKVSGGVTMEHLREIAATGVDRISIGALIKAVRGRLLDAGLLTARGRGPGHGCDPGDPPSPPDICRAQASCDPRTAAEPPWV